MANTKEIKNRIRGVENTKKITKAMKLIAASKLKKARQMHEQTLPFFKHIQEVMADIMTKAPNENTIFFDQRENKKNRKIGYIVIASDSGLNGSYNSNILKYASKNIDKENSIVFPIGNVVRQYMVKNNYTVEEDIGVSKYSVTTISATYIARHMVKLFKEGKIDELRLIYTEMKTIMDLKPDEIKLLPLNKDDFKLEDNKVTATFELEPEPDIVFERLTSQYVKGIIYGGMVESFVSEHSARMMAMDSATTNAENLAKKLNLDYNRARQQAITNEISEIIGGAMNT